MKALILNSGLGSRMGKLTSEHPKCMTEVYGTDTILSRQLKQLLDYGIKEVVITTGAHDEILKSYVRSLSLPINVKFIKNPIFRDTNYIYSIYCAKDNLDDDIVLIHGDLVFENVAFESILKSDKSVMAVSSTLPLPEKDFKAVITDETIKEIGIDCFDNALAAQPLYKLNKLDWRNWLDKIIEFCENNNTKCYAENAFNEISDKCIIYPMDIKDLLCNEIDTPEDLKNISEQLKKVEEKTVYVSFSTDVIHSGHIALINRARRLGQVIIGVISDEVVSSYKRYPMLPFEERKILFENIKGVKLVVKQGTLSYKDNIEKYHPTYVVHGDDWKEGFQKPIRDEVIDILSKYGGELIEFPYADDPKYKILEDRVATKQGILYIEEKYDSLDNWLKESYTKKLFFVSGKSAENHGLFKHIMELEEKIGITVVRFSDFCPNPLYESVEKGVKLFKESGCDSILAMGGGSAIDVAKCIKLFATMDDTKNYLDQRIEENNITLTAIPTTAGTGSEVTRFAVIYYKGLKQSITHESCIPSMIFLDSSFLLTVPDYHRKATYLDALCHSVESYWSVNSTAESKAYAREAIGLLLDNKDNYFRNDSIGNRSIQRASQLAGKAINITQTTAGHAMSYMLTSLFGIAHGHAVGLCVNALWPYMLDHTNDCIDKRGERYFIATMRELATAFDCDTPKEACLKFSNIFNSLKLNKPELRSDEEMEVLLRNIGKERLCNHPILLNEDTIESLYHSILD